MTFLRDFCEGNTTRMQKYIGIYLETTPENLKKIDDAYAQRDYLAVSRIAHTIKPHYNYMGIKQATELSATIERYCNEEINLEQIPQLINKLKEVCEKSFIELA